jgi:uncharacterized membrane protein YhaH (DUF805 family)
MYLVRLCFSFFGRVNRAQYWIGLGIAYGMMMLGYFFVLWLLEPEKFYVYWYWMEDVYWYWIIGLWFVLWYVVVFAVATKRLHDLNISGWWLLGFPFIYALSFGLHQWVLASIGSVALFVGLIWLGCVKGKKSDETLSPSLPTR